MRRFDVIRRFARAPRRGRLYGLVLAPVCLASFLLVGTAAAEDGVNVVLKGGGGADHVRISLSADGTTYLISSSTQLQGGGGVCVGSAEGPDELSCRATAVAGFVFDGGAGGDSVIVSARVPVPVTLRGGPGDDLLVGGGGNDLLLGGSGEDVLLGGPGNNRLVGGPGDDLLDGGPGHNTCIGGGGEDAAVDCQVEKGIAVNCASLRELRATAGTSPCARWGRSHPGALALLAQAIH